MNIVKIILTIVLFTGFGACAPGRTPVPPGEIPTQQTVDRSDEEYGHQVFRALSDQFPLDQDDENIFRVRNIVEKLTQVRENDRSIWHVYILKDDNFKNAAATRGNFIFIWTGMLNTVQNDAQLATVLAHEIGHILAGHTQPSPQEAVNQMLSGLAGEIAAQVIYQQGGAIGALAGLGQLITSQAFQATLVNPESRRKELEADHIGLFLMAEAGYDPQEAVRFWELAEQDGSFGGSTTLAFLSTHPASKTRLQQLRALLPEASRRYQLAERGELEHSTYEYRTGSQPTREWVAPEGWVRGEEDLHEFASSPLPRSTSSGWRVVEDSSPVYQRPDFNSPKVGSLSRGDQLVVREEQRRWLRISAPLEGYTPSFHHTPLR